MLGLGVELVATGDGTDFDATGIVGVGGDQFVQGGLDQELFFGEGGGELVESGGLVGGVDDGFESGDAVFVGHGRVISYQEAVLRFGLLGHGMIQQILLRRVGRERRKLNAEAQRAQRRGREKRGKSIRVEE